MPNLRQGTVASVSDQPTLIDTPEEMEARRAEVLDLYTFVQKHAKIAEPEFSGAIGGVRTEETRRIYGETTVSPAGTLRTKEAHSMDR